MADIGGHGVDEYLESNFQLPEEVSVMLQFQMRFIYLLSSDDTWCALF